ncbi:hypothetical protein GJB61_24345 [Paenibacillus sp. LC-T2]|uniref:Uncharacterized protein n=2 Tax=Paenibacillus monticola TaxID=2666075 RepID=A0A7X2L4A6_9BACL|nr:hypothetical protein [Paenibacillus monticola]
MNKYYPYVTTADSYEFGNISFVENSDIKSCIDSLEYRFVDSIDAEYNIYKYLEVEQLNSLMTYEQISNLHEDEQNQMKYWKPQTIKEIIFNNWD